MTDTIQDRLRDGADRFLKWAHKEQYSGPSVLSIPRHPANIDALLETAAAHIDAQDAKIKVLVEALELARDSHGVFLTSCPPKDAWQYHNVDSVITAALAAAKETT